MAPVRAARIRSRFSNKVITKRRVRAKIRSENRDLLSISRPPGPSRPLFDGFRGSLGGLEPSIRPLFESSRATLKTWGCAKVGPGSNASAVPDFGAPTPSHRIASRGRFGPRIREAGGSTTEPHGPAGTVAGGRAGGAHDQAVGDDPRDPFGVLEGRLVGRAVDDRGRVEDGHVGIRPGTQDAPVAQAELGGDSARSSCGRRPPA